MRKNVVINRKYIEHVVWLIARHCEIEMDANFHGEELIVSVMEKDGDHLSYLRIMDDGVDVNGEVVLYDEITRVIFEADRSWDNYEYGIAFRLTDDSVIYSGLIGNYDGDVYIDVYHFARMLYDNHVTHSVYSVLSHNHIPQKHK